MSTRIKIDFVEPEQTLDLRHRILRAHQPRESCSYPGDAAATTFHLAAFEGSKIVCVGTFMKEASPEFKESAQYRLRGMATDDGFRRRGAGASLLLRAFEILNARDCRLLWCYARQVAFPFYEKMGFEYLGALFEIDGIGPHKVMYRKIPGNSK